MFNLKYLVALFFILLTFTFNANAYCPFDVLNRKLIKEIPEGYIVQDFYKTGEKYTNPFLVKDKLQALMKEVPFNECFGYDENMSRDDILIEGYYIIWSKSGKKVMEGYYKKGKKNGLFTTWYINDLKRTEVLYIDDKKEGLYTQWFDNGDKNIEEYYKNGKLDGKRTEWFRGNIKNIEAFYNNDQLNGKKTTWFGQKMIEDFYKNGQLNGETSYWCIGKKYMTTIYKEGKEVSTKYFFTIENAEKDCKIFIDNK